MQRTLRLKREIQMLSQHPPPSILCWQEESDKFQLKAQIIGGEGTPYENGLFSIDINLPDRYPFEPPLLHFKTPIYHPNIDSNGRICLDILKTPPQGSWKPSLNISSVLTSIQLLMNDPNPDDPLMVDIASEYMYNRPLFVQRAKESTAKHALNLMFVSQQKKSPPATVKRTESVHTIGKRKSDDSGPGSDSVTKKGKLS